MKITVSLLDEDNKPLILNESIGFKESEESDFIQIAIEPFSVPGEGLVSVSMTLTLYNLGCCLIVEQNEVMLLNASFGANYQPAIVIKLENGSLIQVYIDVSEEIKSE
ncbi:MAG: hypothetical protein ABW127_05885 [Candidatus Thiodiazotropha endolucinida]